MSSKFSAVKQLWNRYRYSFQCLPRMTASVLHKDSLLSKSFSWNNNNTLQSVKIKNRCVFSNRSRAVFNQLKLTRMVFKNLATYGLLNGVKKHSW